MDPTEYVICWGREVITDDPRGVRFSGIIAQRRTFWENIKTMHQKLGPTILFLTLLQALLRAASAITAPLEK